MEEKNENFKKKVDKWSSESIPLLIKSGKQKEMIKALEEGNYLKEESENSFWGIFIVLMLVAGILIFLGLFYWEIHQGKFQSIINSTCENSNECPICPELPNIPSCPASPVCPVPLVNVTINPNINVNINSS